jgi:hypothetical protein
MLICRSAGDWDPDWDGVSQSSGFTKYNYIKCCTQNAAKLGKSENFMSFTFYL